MITINSSPIENRILLDGNNTVISISSSNGSGHYFRAFIYIDYMFFDEQGWSRKDNFTAEKDLKNLYKSYFKTIFQANFENGIFDQSHLQKRVTIIIKEFLLEDDSLVQTLQLPDFFIMYNNFPAAFNDEDKVQFLGTASEILLIPENGKLSIPFMANAVGESVYVELKNNFGTVVNSRSVASFSGKKTFLYNFDLSSITLIANTIYFTLKITVGSAFIYKNIRLLTLPDYPVREVAYLNNFGYWNYVYFDGLLSIDSVVSVETYEELDGSEKVFEISEKETFTLNTGSLLASEKQIISHVQKSLQTKLFFQNEWLEMVNQNKKSNIFKDRNNSYSENLVFGLKRNPSVANVGMTVPEIPEEGFIVIDSAQTYGNSALIKFHFNDYSPSGIGVVINKDGSVLNYEGSLISPMIIWPIFAGYQNLYLKSSDNELIKSNEVTLNVSASAEVTMFGISSASATANILIANLTTSDKSGYRLVYFKETDPETIFENIDLESEVLAASTNTAFSQTVPSSGKWFFYLKKITETSNILGTTLTF